MSEEIKISEAELEGVSGGAGSWENYAKGKVDYFSDHVFYTGASGDVLSGIALRFGVTVAKIQQWNNIKNPDVISVGQKLIIYPSIVR